MATLISDLVTEVMAKLENRTDATTQARAAIWIRDALLEIGANPTLRDDFKELEVQGPTFVLTALTREYAETNILPATTASIATLDIILWTDPPGNTNTIRLNPTHYQEADRYTQLTKSQPTDWYRFANNIGFIPTPSLAYQVQARIMQMHPLSGTLASTTILLPVDWNEVLVWSAVERGFMELLEFEKAAGVHKMLFGDPKRPGEPGLMYSRKKTRKREGFRDSVGLRPIVRGYGYGRR